MADKELEETVPRSRKRSAGARIMKGLILGLAALLVILGCVYAGRKLIRKYGRGHKAMDGFYIDLDKENIPERGNGQQYIAIHYLGAVGETHRIEPSGVGAHFYIYYDGTIYQSADLDAVVWQVGPGSSGYAQLHPEARNANTIGIELCVKCDGDSTDAKDPTWYFTEETQEAAVKLVRRLMDEMDVPISHVLRHGDIVDKWCPAPYLLNNSYESSWTWDEFLAEVSALPAEEVPAYPIVKEP